MSEVRIAAEPRTQFGKGAARRIRRDKKVPAVLYGHGESPRHIALPGHELMLALKTANVLLELDLGGARELALPKDVQRDPVKGHLEHVDLILVRRGEKVVVDVPVHTTGEVAGDGLLVVESQTLSVEAEATHLPTAVEVDVEGFEVGHQIHAGDVALPEGATLAADPELLVLNVAAAPSAEQIDAELAGAEAEAGIVHDAPEADSEDAAGAAEGEVSTPAADAAPTGGAAETAATTAGSDAAASS